LTLSYSIKENRSYYESKRQAYIQQSESIAIGGVL
jgi:hypothetical protein